MSRAERLSPAQTFSRRRLLQAAGVSGLSLSVTACVPGESSEEKIEFKLEGEIRLPQVASATEGVPTPELLQSNLPKIFPAKVEISEESPRGQKQEGWKWVTVQLGLENASDRELPLGLFRKELDAVVIRTNENFQYGPESGPFEYATYLKLPPGFRAKGRKVYEPGATDRVPTPLIEVGFRVAQKTSSYKLAMPGFPDLDLVADLAEAEKLQFPTDRPESDFREIGETITVPGKGKVTLLEVGRDGYRFRYENASQGYEAPFNFSPTVIDTDGFWWTPMRENGKVRITVGPGLVKEGTILETKLPLSVKGGKLILTGDINEIFNLRIE